MNALKDLHIGISMVYTPCVYMNGCVWGMVKPMNYACAF